MTEETTRGQETPDSEDAGETLSLGQGETRALDRSVVSGQTQRPGEALSAEVRLGRYRLIRELGSGGQGAVYLAEDEQLKRNVALKVLNVGARLSAHARLRFEREAETTGRLNHPGIARVFEFGEENGVLFIAMEFVEGETLESMIRQSRNRQDSSGEPGAVMLNAGVDPGRTTQVQPSQGTALSSDQRPFAEIARFMEDAARAIHVAHESGLVHRDIKPANIMMRQDGRVCLLDFGLAHDDHSTEVTLTQSGDVFGTPAYMAPEQVRGQTHSIDPRTDVWALGAVLYECCTLCRPFAGATRHDLFREIVQREPVPPSHVNRRIPGDLAAIILTALDKDPERRYASALDLAEDLRRLRHFEAIHARPAGHWVKTLRWVQRNRTVAAMGLLVFLALIGVVVALYLRGQEQKRAFDTMQSAKVRIEEESRRTSAALVRERAALADFERLADDKRLEEAEKEAEELWPARPWTVEAMESWLARYRPLLKAWPEHEASLRKLREKASPYREEDRRRDHGEELARLTSLRKQREEQAASLKEVQDDAERKKLSASLTEINHDIQELETLVNQRKSWDFGDDNVIRWKHDIQTQIVNRLRRFAAPEDGLYAGVRKRCQRARAILDETVTKYRDGWIAAIRAVRTSPHYGGFKLSAQVGLIPLGADPRSGLQEFLHWETHRGPIPERDEKGNLSLTENTGLIFVLIPRGQFWMGSQKEDPGKPNYDPRARSDEPLHEVVIEQPFLLSKFEMTQGQWRRSWPALEQPSFYRKGFQGRGMTSVVNDMHPVEQVSLLMCDKVLLHIGLSLPTEEQWEYAARAGQDGIWAGGTRDIGKLREWGNLAGQEAARVFPAHEKEHRDPYIIHAPVGSFKPNAFGLHDVTGNLWEWTRSTFKGLYCIRGGGFGNLAYVNRLAYRYHYTELQRDHDLGLRPLCPLQP